MKLFYLLLPICLFIISCGKTVKNTENQATLIDSVYFKTDFKAPAKYTGQFFDKKTNRDYYFFANPLSLKVIKVFDDKGSLVNEILLDSIYSNLNAYPSFRTVTYINFSSLNELYILSASEKKLFELNQDGNIKKQISIAALLSQPDTMGFELYSKMSSSTSIDDNGNQFYIIQFNKRGSATQNEYEFWKQNSITQWHEDNIIQLNVHLQSDSVRHHTGFKFYQKLSPKDSTKFIVPFFDYTVSDQHIIMSSYQSNQVFVVDKNNFSLVKKVEFEFEDIKLGLPLFEFDSAYNNPNYLSDLSRFNTNYISEVHYNPYLNHYYVVLSMESEEYPGSWLVDVFDSNFNAIKRLRFDNDSYNSSLLYTRKGFLVESGKHPDEHFYYEFTY